jgi:hypothetical protein
MSGPPDRDRGAGDGGFDDGGSGWREPAHLGEGNPQAGDTPPAADPQQPDAQQPDPQQPDPQQADAEQPDRSADRAAEGAGWQPAGWDLPSVDPARPREAGYESWSEDRAGPQAPPQQLPARGGGLFGSRGPRQPTEVEKVFAYQGDTVGAQGWAVQHGWGISDGTGPADAGLAELIATAPTRLTREHRPAGVMRGRYGSFELVAFDVVYADKRRVIPEYAVTAAPVLATAPGLRLSPARFWKHRTGGLVPIPSGDPEFDARWVLLAGEDGPAVRRLVEDPTVRGLLLGSDDGDEFWSATGYVAAIRPDGHRPELIEHHARLLAAVVGALAVAG